MSNRNSLLITELAYTSNRPGEIIPSAPEAPMEHLFDVSDLPRARPFLIPYRWLGFDHDTAFSRPVVPFDEYPTLRGWSRVHLEQLRLGRFVDKDPASALCMLQSWLFFGLLESAFQEHFPSSMFLRYHEPPPLSEEDPPMPNVARILSTEALRTYYDNWVLKFPDLPTDTKARLEPSFTNTMLVAWDWVLFLVTKLGPRTPEYSSTGPHSKDLVAIIRTTILVLEFLTRCCPFGNDHSVPFQKFSAAVDPGDELRKRLAGMNWCPSAFPLLYRKLGLSGVVYATTLDASEMAGIDHVASKCTRTECKAYNIDTSTYEPRHWCKGQDCEMLVPPVQDVCEALDKGTFPLIDGEALLSSPANSRPIVTPHREGTPFVAFSHVWFDGHGSVTEKGLPRCQLETLTGLTTLLCGEPTLFWIDSLCVPEDPDRRMKAIIVMADTYALATDTLVIDGSLRRCSTSRPTAEIALRMVVSVWMRRLWTLPEGLLAKRLTFLLSDALVLLDHFLSRIFEQDGEADTGPGPVSLWAMLELLAMKQDIYGPGRAADLRHIHTLLMGRTSTRPEDETIAVAPVFNIDVKKLLPLKEERRMMEFWRLVGSIPVGMLFAGSVERIQEHRGWRWAPRRLMTSFAGTIGSPNARIVPDRGLVAELVVLEFEKPGQRFRWGKAYWVCDAEKRRSYTFSRFREECVGHEGMYEGGFVCNALALQPGDVDNPSIDVVVLVRAGEEPDEFEFVMTAFITANEFNSLIDWEDVGNSVGNLGRSHVVARSRQGQVLIA